VDPKLRGEARLACQPRNGGGKVTGEKETDFLIRRERGRGLEEEGGVRWGLRRYTRCPSKRKKNGLEKGQWKAALSNWKS